HSGTLRAKKSCVAAGECAQIIERNGINTRPQSQKRGHDVAPVTVHTGLVGLEPNPTKGGYEYATVWKRCGDDVVHQLVEDDTVPRKLIRSQGECAISLLD